jgi:hypothetical protein
MTVVVVQSDELAAWIGVAGVVVGVVLTAGIDWWKSRRAEQKQKRKELIRAGDELAQASAAVAELSRLAGNSANEVPWIEALNARQSAIIRAHRTIREAGVKEIDDAADEIVAATQHSGNAIPFDLFRDAVLKAKL